MAYENVKFVTTDGTRWGAGTGAPLPASEIDLNFWEVISRIVELEDNPPEPVNISDIQVVGSQLTIFLTDGTNYGPFTLPVAQFHLRDEWLPGGVQYYELDLVSVTGRGLYMVRIDHLSGATFDPDAIDGGGNLLYMKVFGEDTYIYKFGLFYPGKPGMGIESGDPMFAHLITEPIYMLMSDTGSAAKLTVAPAVDLSFDLMKNATSIGTLDFTAADPDGVMTLTANVTFADGDVFYMMPPTSLDDDARNLTFTVKAFLGTPAP